MWVPRCIPRTIDGNIPDLGQQEIINTAKEGGRYNRWDPKYQQIYSNSYLDADGYILSESKLNKVNSLVINNSWDKIVSKGYPIIKIKILNVLSPIDEGLLVESFRWRCGVVHSQTQLS